MDPVKLGPADPVDLHLHTLASDGSWTPEALFDRLAEGGFRVVAVCDHDNQRSVTAATRLGAELGMHVVPGVEVTTNWRDRQWHLLVYGIGPERDDAASAPFRSLLTQIDQTLMAVAADAQRRIEASGRALPSLPQVLAGRPQWPFHVLSAAINDGHAKNLKEAAELVTELGGSFTADLPLGEVVEAAHQAGGVCLVAHPGRSDSVGVMTEADLDAMLAEVPIDGLEGHYRSYTDAQTALYRDLATARGLLISCGSDSHGPNQPVDPRPWRAAWCADLLERLGFAVEPLPAGEPVWTAGMDPLAVVPKPDEPATADPTADRDGQADPPGEQLLEAEAAREHGGSNRHVPAAEQLVVEIFVRDIAHATAFYEELGFTRRLDKGAFVALSWDGCALFLEERPDLPGPGDHPAANVRVMVPNVDALWARARALGATVYAPIADRDYGLRDFTVLDPDGFGVRFASRRGGQSEERASGA